MEDALKELDDKLETFLQNRGESLNHAMMLSAWQEVRWSLLEFVKSSARLVEDDEIVLRRFETAWPALTDQSESARMTRVIPVSVWQPMTRPDWMMDSSYHDTLTQGLAPRFDAYVFEPAKKDASPLVPGHVWAWVGGDWVPALVQACLKELGLAGSIRAPVAQTLSELLFAIFVHAAARQMTVLDRFRATLLEMRNGYVPIGLKRDGSGALLVFSVRRLASGHQVPSA